MSGKVSALGQGMQFPHQIAQDGHYTVYTCTKQSGTDGESITGMLGIRTNMQHNMLGPSGQALDVTAQETMQLSHMHSHTRLGSTAHM